MLRLVCVIMLSNVSMGDWNMFIRSDGREVIVKGGSHEQDSKDFPFYWESWSRKIISRLCLDSMACVNKALKSSNCRELIQALVWQIGRTNSCRTRRGYDCLSCNTYPRHRSWFCSVRRRNIQGGSCSLWPSWPSQRLESACCMRCRFLSYHTSCVELRNQVIGGLSKALQYQADRSQCSVRILTSDNLSRTKSCCFWCRVWIQLLLVCRHSTDISGSLRAIISRGLLACTSR